MIRALLLAVLLAGCTTKPPVYLCFPAQIESSGQMVLACLPQGETK